MNTGALGYCSHSSMPHRRVFAFGSSDIFDHSQLLTRSVAFAGGFWALTWLFCTWNCAAFACGFGNHRPHSLQSADHTPGTPSRRSLINCRRKQCGVCLSPRPELTPTDNDGPQPTLAYKSVRVPLSLYIAPQH